MIQSALFWNLLARRYSKQPIANEAAYQKKLKKTQEYFSPDMEVLEFGCGTGSTAIIHAPFVKHILAIDLSQKMLAFAQEKADAKNIKNVTFQCTTIESLNLPAESLDVVMGHSIMHLLENKEAVIKKIYKILKPGGVFVSSTACIGDTMKFIRPVMAMGSFFGLLPLLRYFTAKDLAESITQAGFEIDYQWQPENDLAVFIVAKKSG